MSTPDLTTLSGARLLKAKLEAYYRERGEKVPEFTVEKVKRHNGNKSAGELYQLRSNLKLGVPRKW